jgi:hypothetical protein
MIKYESKYLLYGRAIDINMKYYIKRILYPISAFYYKLLLDLFHPKSIRNKKYKISLCTIFRNEGSYLKEWIEYHKIIGVEHFYLYNNFSIDDYREVLQPYIKDGFVTLIDWIIPQGQMSAYSDCVSKYSAETQWIGFIDLDEFVVPNKFDNIYQFLSKFEKNRPIVIIYWKYFGSSGKIQRDLNGLVTEDFIVAWSKYGAIGKCFYNTNYDYAPELKENQFMHNRWGKFKNIKLPPVNLLDKICIWGLDPVDTEDFSIQVNHYVIKTYNEFLEKKSKRGGGIHKIGFHDNDYFFHHDSYSQSIDYHIYKYLIKLKLALDIKS